MSPREMATGASGRSPTTSVRDGHHRVDLDLRAAANRVDVGTDGLRGVRGVDRLAARCHRLKRIPRISAGVAWTDGQPSGPGELALPPAARGEPGRLVPLGRRGACPRAPRGPAA